jgi:hypothetical protein
MNEMQELVSPQQSETLVLLASALITVIGAGLGYRELKTRGLLAGLCGPLVWSLWQMHKYVTRYDPQTGYFGLDKVKVLLSEVVLFVVLGAVLGWAWGTLSRSRDNFTAKDAKDAKEETGTASPSPTS